MELTTGSTLVEIEAALTNFEFDPKKGDFSDQVLAQFDFINEIQAQVVDDFEGKEGVTDGIVMREVFARIEKERPNLTFVERVSIYSYCEYMRGKMDQSRNKVGIRGTVEVTIHSIGKHDEDSALSDTVSEAIRKAISTIKRR